MKIEFHVAATLLDCDLIMLSIPCSSYCARVIQNCGLSFITSARTAPPIKTISLRLGGSSTRILNFCNFCPSPFNTRSRYNCLISRSNLDGRPGYIVDPPLRTMCLYNSLRRSRSALLIVLNNSSDIPCPSILTK